MHRKDDISKLFQNSQHNLEERPSSRAWQRLEQKLDAKKARHRRLLYRYVSTVAAVIAVLAMITAISVFDFPQNKEMANQNATETPTIALNNNDVKRLEEFKKSEGIDKSVAELLEEQEVKSEEEEEGIDIYVEDEDYKSKEQIAQHIPKLMPKPTPTKTVESVVEKDALPMLEEEEIAEEVEAEFDDQPVMDEVTIVETVTPSPSVKKEAIPSNKYKQDKVRVAKKKKILDKMAARRKNRSATKATPSAPSTTAVEISSEGKMFNQMEQPTVMVLSNVTLADFKWLEGEWEDTKKGSGVSSYEKWEKKGKNTLVGEGFLSSSDGNKSFSETMKIRKKGGNIYYYTKLQENGDLIKFKLIQFDGSIAVFENKDIAFPQQIILQKKGSSTFSTVFQNTQNMSKVQEKQLKYRNNISRERATRVLKRRVDKF